MTSFVDNRRLLAGRYRLVARLGRGGFGEVWRAEDTVLAREVAVKTLAVSPDENSSLLRFEQEARALARLNHPNVVAVFDSGSDDGTAYVVMELLAGPSLAVLLAERGPLTVDEGLDYASQAAAGLAASHRAGIVHRDVSPGNLILDGQGTLKVVDFGVARLAEGSTALTVTGTVFATPGYVSPEQAAGRPADARSDLYALGCVLYALLAGEPPFTAEHPIGVVQQHLTSPPPALGSRRADVPPELDGLLTDLLAKDPDDRPASADLVQRRLDAIRARLRGGNEPTAATRVLVQPRRRSRWLIAAAAFALVALGALLATIFTGGGTTASPPRATSQTTTRPAAPTTITAPRVAPAAPSTPEQAIAATRTAIAAEQNQGQLDPSAAGDLNHQLDDIGQALQHPNPNDAAHKVDDLLHHLSDLAQAGQLSSAGVSRISAPLNRLAALLPATPPPGPHGHGRKKKGDAG